MGVEAVVAVVSHHKHIPFRDDLAINKSSLIRNFHNHESLRSSKSQNERIPENTKERTTKEQENRGIFYHWLHLISEWFQDEFFIANNTIHQQFAIAYLEMRPFLEFKRT